MTTTRTHTVRYFVAMILLGLTLFTLIESALGAGRTTVAAAEGLSACGTEAQPCVLPALTVELAPEGTHLASSERAPRMVLRVGS